MYLSYIQNISYSQNFPSFEKEGWPGQKFSYIIISYGQAGVVGSGGLKKNIEQGSTIFDFRGRTVPWC
jgi:hypothetical protein